MYSHLTFRDRLTIERMMKKGYSKQAIADAIGCCLATIYNELKRGQCKQLTTELIEFYKYSPEYSQRLYVKKKSRGFTPKIKSDPKLQEYLRHLIVDKRLSPKAAMFSIKNKNLKFDLEIKSVNTIYKAIRDGNINGVKMVDLPLRNKHIKRKCKVKVEYYAHPEGKSIECRDKSILSRNEFGHWEMDTVIGKQKNRKCLLVLTERKTRYEIIEILKSRTNDEVRKAINRLEKRYGAMFYHIFKTITVDNGCEFKKYLDIEKAIYRIGNRTKLYYCHPYCPSERGSNENNNKLIRRFLPKSSDFDKILNRNIVKKIEKDINDYPRELLSGYSSKYFYDLELAGMEFT